MSGFGGGSSENELEILRLRLRIMELERQNQNNSASNTSETSRPSHAIAIVPPPDEYRRERRNPRTAFSPGYGLRPDNVEERPLDPSANFVTEEGTQHRVYPAPTHPSPPADVTSGWDDSPKPSEEVVNAPVPQAPSSAGSSDGAPVVTPATSDGSYIPWVGGVQYDESVILEDEPTLEDIREVLASISRGKDKERDGGFDNDRPTNNFGRPPAGGGSGTCYRCNEQGHMSRDCPNGGGSGGGSGNCFRCNEPGHISRDCPNGGGGFGGGGSFSGQCYNCGQEGHSSRDCSSGPKCRNCNELGHMSYECPRERNNNSFSPQGPTLGGSGWGGGSSTSLNAAPSSSDNDGWGNETSEPTSSSSSFATARQAAPINPERARMMESPEARRSGYQRGPIPNRQGPMPPQDNGWGQRAGRSHNDDFAMQNHQEAPSMDLATEDINSEDAGGW